MSSSYYRNCKKCGRRIQLRKMPGGQWVAYEGYENIHNCKEKPVKKESGYAQAIDNNSSSIDFITGFSLEKPPIEKKVEIQKTASFTKSDGISSYVENEINRNKTQTIDQAILKNQILSIIYRDRNGKVTTRDINPVSRQSNILNAHCRLRNASRQFIINNINSIEIKENVDKIKSGIDELMENNYKPVKPANAGGCFSVFLFFVLASIYVLEKIV